VRHNLRAIRDKPSTDDKEKLTEYGKGLVLNVKVVGDYIEQLTRDMDPTLRAKRRRHLWYPFPPLWSDTRCFVRNFWPSSISHKRLQGMYESVVKREREKATKNGH
jgi:hypothetical protein